MAVRALAISALYLLWTYQGCSPGPAAIADTVDDAHARAMLYLVPLLVAIVVIGAVLGSALDAINSGPAPRRSGCVTQLPVDSGMFEPPEEAVLWCHNWHQVRSSECCGGSDRGVGVQPR
ncbi:hypothetical protein Srufu_004050 [Streptomyces libani subsp. rufus]|nr:hypothetical protein Srufu_004050 [Streptomyces libani subsp. rufus]